VSTPRVAVLPPIPQVEEAVRAGGGTLVSDPAEAEAIVWMNPADPDGLRDALAKSRAKWVQLPFAGIEEFLAAGVIDPARTWTCAKGTYGPTVAEHALAQLLMAARLLHRHARQRSWMSRRDFATARRLAGATVLLVGTGGIGAALAEMLVPLEPRIIGVNRSGTPLAGAERTVSVKELKAVVGEADFVVLSAAMTPETTHLFNAEVLVLMRPDAWIVNVGRGKLIDTDALVDALRDKRIGGAALDVTDPEPLPDDHPLWTIEDVVITSHAANTWEMAIPDLAERIRRNVELFARGEPLEGLVDLGLGY
jgi:phosphoglycerate dehydrogenase-like enzyme